VAPKTGGRVPQMKANSDDLPQPLGPMMVTTSPAGTLASSFSNSRTPSNIKQTSHSSSKPAGPVFLSSSIIGWLVHT
jgi:hypothetical protein